MNADKYPDNPYFLLTPGPLSTSKTVKAVMLRDWCTWDNDYNCIVQDIRGKIVALAASEPGYTSVLLQGSGTFSVEAAIGCMVPGNGKLLVLANGAYGDRIGTIARYLGIPYVVHDSGELSRPDLRKLEDTLSSNTAITHVAVVHCETTTGMLNPVKEIGGIVKSHGRIFLVDAMSSFGGVPLDMAQIGADFLVSSANKCIQGVPGFGFIVAREDVLERCRDNARSLSFDIYDQWATMEKHHGKWRFTSPTHTVRAFKQALVELDEEGGVEKRFERYCENHRILVDGMESAGFECVLPEEYRSPIITAFHEPKHDRYEFRVFYERLKKKGFVIYPGKVTRLDTFRIGTIGHVFPDDIRNLVQCVKESIYW